MKDEDAAVSEGGGGDGVPVGIGGESENDGYRFWREQLRGARLVVAPMVDASELAWRMLSRRHGAELCYTPMMHSVNFVKDPKYRKENFQSCAEDRPLVAQFCANDPKVFVQAVSLVKGRCDAVDLNLGCPQSIAKRGHYGSFLQDEWDLVHELVSSVRKEVGIPITCKIRVFPDVDKTVEYAKMLERAGCFLLTVHGRTREQKGRETGVASWAHIKAVKQAVKIPVFANGNIQYLNDVHRCMEETGVEGVMSAEGNLHNPAIFDGASPPVWEMAEEYMELLEKYPAPLSYVRGHLFKLLHHCLTLPESADLREILASGSNFDDFRRMVCELKNRFLPFHRGESEFSSSDESYRSLPAMPWICQPYVRPPPKPPVPAKSVGNGDSIGTTEPGTGCGTKRISEVDPESLASEAAALRPKKTKRKGNKRKEGEEKFVFHLCAKDGCANPKGSRCCYSMCKNCCRVTCRAEVLDCVGHHIRIKTGVERSHDHDRRLSESGG